MKMAEIMILTGASHGTIYRWINERGFPQSQNGEWDPVAVTEWWDANKSKVGRWPRR